MSPPHSTPWTLITGASSGIGEALAHRLARQGARLVIVARRAAVLEDLALALRAQGAAEVRVVPLDLSDPHASTTLAARTAELDIARVVLNAGYGTSGPFLDTDLDAEQAMIAVNVAAVHALAHTFARRLAVRGSGEIVLLGSIVGFQGVPYTATYAATKAFVQSLGEALAIELRPHGVQVRTIAPGPTATGFADRAGLTLGPAATSDTVAAEILASTNRRGTFFPGALAKLLRGLFATLPRALAARVFGTVMRGMARGPEGARRA